MAAIAQEVARVQVEMQQIKGDALQGITQQLEALKTEATNIDFENEGDSGNRRRQVDNEWGRGDAHAEQLEDDASRHSREAMTYDDYQGDAYSASDALGDACLSPPPSLRRKSSYGSEGKLTPSQRSVLPTDNAGTHVKITVVGCCSLFLIITTSGE